MRQNEYLAVRKAVTIKLAVPLLLAAVIFISGCTAIGGPGGIFGADVINVKTRTVEEPGRDPIVIRDVMTIPTSPVLPDQEVYFSFIIDYREIGFFQTLNNNFNILQ